MNVGRRRQPAPLDRRHRQSSFSVARLPARRGSNSPLIGSQWKEPCTRWSPRSRGTREHAGGEGSRSEGHGRGVPAQSAESFPCPQRSHAGGARPPSLRTRCCPWLRIGRVYLRRSPRRRQPPSRFRPGLCFWLRPTVSTFDRLIAGRPAAAVCADQRGSENFD